MSSISVAGSSNVVPASATIARPVEREVRVEQQPAPRHELRIQELSSKLKQADADTRIRATNEGETEQSQSIAGVAERGAQHARSVATAASNRVNYAYTAAPVEHQRPQTGALIDTVV